METGLSIGCGGCGEKPMGKEVVWGFIVVVLGVCIWALRPAGTGDGPEGEVPEPVVGRPHPRQHLRFEKENATAPTVTVTTFERATARRG